jgi:SAM-dependent methyltransferase
MATRRRPWQPAAVTTSQVWDDETAASYDTPSTGMFAPEVLDPAVEFLAGLAPGGRALEFAIGTGRVALPLSDRGVTVAGIDLSEAMVNVLRAKPGAERIDVVIGDMATATVPGAFDLVYLVFNTITNLLTQGEQVTCFRNAARHLKAGGRFVIETFVPDLQRLPVGALAQAFAIEDNHVGFDTFDLVRQRLVSHHYTIADGQARVFHSQHRYVWPSELDLMGEIAGLRLVERWADWGKAPFTATSGSHVSVWRKP